jgi:hypothetical protein
MFAARISRACTSAMLDALLLPCSISTAEDTGQKFFRLRKADAQGIPDK